MGLLVLLYYFFAAVIAGIVLLVKYSISHPNAANKEKTIKKKNPTAWLNVLLYAGSFLLGMSIIFFTKQINKAYVAPAIIITSILIYAAGMVLFLRSKHLKPVAYALVGTILSTMPFWAAYFSEMGIQSEFSMPMALVCCTLLFFLSGIVFKASWLVSFSSVWLLLLILSLGVYCDNETAGLLIFTAAPVTLAFFALAAWKNRVKWVPMICRRSVILTSYLYPIISTLALIFVAMLEPSETGISTIPCFFGLNCALLTLYLAYFYAKTHSAPLKHFLRCAAHISFLVLTYEVIIKTILADSAQEFTLTLAWSCIWGFSFIAEMCYSLLRMRKTKKYGPEVPYLIASAFFLLNTISFGAYPNNGLGAYIELAVFIAFITLGVVFSVLLRNISWAIASGFGLLLMPLIISDIYGSSDPAIFLVLYGIIGALFAGFYAATHSIKPKQTFIFSLVSICLTAPFLIGSASDMGFEYIGWALTAGYLFVVYLLSKRWGVLEAVIYLFAIAIYSLLSDLLDTPYYISSVESFRTFLFFHITGGALLITSAIRELNNRKLGPRFIIAYIWLTFIQLFAVGEFISEGMYLYGLLYLMEQVVALVFGVFKHRLWIIICSLIGLVLATIMMASGRSFIWLAILGIALIAIVAWRLSAINKAEQANESEEK